MQIQDAQTRSETAAQKYALWAKGYSAVPCNQGKLKFVIVGFNCGTHIDVCAKKGLANNGTRRATLGTQNPVCRREILNRLSAREGSSSRSHDHQPLPAQLFTVNSSRQLLAFRKKNHCRVKRTVAYVFQQFAAPCTE